MTPSLNVQAYVAAFEQLRKLAETPSPGNAAVTDVLEDQLDELWGEMSVEECREIEHRYPELKLRRFG